MLDVQRWRKKLAHFVAPLEFGDAVAFEDLVPQVVPEAPITVHMLWVEGALSQLEQLCAASFVYHGYEVWLWSYGEVSGVPEGVEVRDARAVLSEERVFRIHGGLATFSDLFRYKVLSLFGGLWSDTDVICLLHSDELRARLPDGFLVTELARDGRKRRINGNLIYAPSPARGDIIDLALAVMERFDLSRLKWADCGPKLLTALARTYPAVMPVVMVPAFCNPVPAHVCPEFLTAPARAIPPRSSFLHCYNESWKARRFDKNARWPPDSVLGVLQRRLRQGRM